MSRKNNVNAERNTSTARALIWLPLNASGETRKKNKSYRKSLAILEKKLGKTSILDRQLKLLEENNFSEICFVCSTNSLNELINKELEKRKDYWSSKGIRFLFCHPKKLLEQMTNWQNKDPTGFILSISAEWLFDPRIIETFLQQNISFEEEKEEEQPLDTKSHKLVFFQEDRTDFLIKSRDVLCSERFLPLMFIPMETIPSIVEQASVFSSSEMPFESISDLLALCLQLPHQVISLSTLPTYIPSMRRALPIYYFIVKEKKDLRRVKWKLVKLTQKGTLDFIAWYFNRPFENLLVYLLANSPLTPNHITILVNILAFLAAGCFIASPYIVTSFSLLSKILPWLAFAGLVGVNILDGVDGKLARIRNKLTLLGHIEHSFDQLYEQTVYFAACWYCIHIAEQRLAPWIFLVIAFLIIDTFNRHVSMQYYIVMRISLADSGRLDRAFRRIDGRRNTYTIHILIFLLLPSHHFLTISMLTHAILTGLVYASRAIYHLKRADKGIFPGTKKETRS